MKPRARREHAILRWRSRITRGVAKRRRQVEWLTADEWDTIRRITRFRENLREDRRDAYEQELLLWMLEDRTPADGNSAGTRRPDHT